MKYELILGNSIGILLVFRDKLFFLDSACQIPLFAKKKKDLVRIELTFLQELSVIVRVNMKLRRQFLSIFVPRHF